MTPIRPHRHNTARPAPRNSACCSNIGIRRPHGGILRPLANGRLLQFNMKVGAQFDLGADFRLILEPAPYFNQALPLGLVESHRPI